jgi:hypothetical protein
MPGRYFISRVVALVSKGKCSLALVLSITWSKKEVPFGNEGMTMIVTGRVTTIYSSRKTCHFGTLYIQIGGELHETRTSGGVSFFSPSGCHCPQQCELISHHIMSCISS